MGPTFPPGWAAPQPTGASSAAVLASSKGLLRAAAVLLCALVTPICLWSSPSSPVKTIGAAACCARRLTPAARHGEVQKHAGYVHGNVQAGMAGAYAEAGVAGARAQVRCITLLLVHCLRPRSLCWPSIVADLSMWVLWCAYGTSFASPRLSLIMAV